MFKIASLIYITFTGLYVLFSASVIYHLMHFELPSKHASRVVMAAYVALSTTFLLMALLFLFQIPS